MHATDGVLPIAVHRSGTAGAGEVQSLSVRVAAYAGPMDLLLKLVRANEVDIYDIPIADITRQYLDHVRLLDSLDLSTAGDYLVMAATLVEIKSRMLLPPDPAAAESDEADDPRAELATQLAEYEAYRQSVDTLRAREEARRDIFLRGGAPEHDSGLQRAPGAAGAGVLAGAMSNALAKSVLARHCIVTVAPRRRVTLRMKMVDIARRVFTAGERGIPFDSLGDVAVRRVEIVLAFLAMLELVRLGRLRARQRAPYGRIWLRPAGTTPATAVVRSR